MTAVFLDACVLVPITLTNVILTAAEAGLVRPHWSAEVVEEAVEAILEIRPGLAEDRIRRRFAAMNAAFEGASVSGDPAALDGTGFPDPDDLHVVAAAIAAEARMIVTANIRDFPSHVLAVLGLNVVSPDQLLLGLLEEDAEATVNVVVEVATALRNPQRTIEDLLASLSLAGARRFAAEVRKTLAT
jgi:predicted nucleic acid-binding protein